MERMGGVPDKEQERLAGPSAYVLYKHLLRVTTLFACASGIIYIAIFTGIVQPSWFANLLFGVFLLAGLSVAFFLMWAGLKDWAETREGYTSLPYRRKDLQQRDPYLGEVIREASAEYLHRQVFFDICDRAKALSERRKSG